MAGLISAEPVVHWTILSKEPDDLDLHPRAARLGAIVAVAICVVIGVGGWLIAPAGGWIVAAIGLPGAMILGAYLAPRAIAADDSGLGRVISQMAIGTALIGDGLASGVLAGAAFASSAGPMAYGGYGQGTELLWLAAVSLVGAVYLFVVGLIVTPGVVLFVTMPAATAWAITVRWLPARAGRGDR